MAKVESVREVVKGLPDPVYLQKRWRERKRLSARRSKKFLTACAWPTIAATWWRIRLNCAS